MGALGQGRCRNRAILLLAAWILGYPGIVYGGLPYLPTCLVAHGWPTRQIFLWGDAAVTTLIAAVGIQFPFLLT